MWDSICRRNQYSINQKILEHGADIRHNCFYSSTIVEHAEKTKYSFCIEESKVIAKIDHFHHRKLREAIEIKRHAKNLNRDDGWKLSKSWIPALFS